MKNSFYLLVLICSFSSVKAGFNNFTNLVFVEDWLIERKIDSTTNEIKCRASIPANANWFGARVRLGSNNELIKPIWISLNAEQLLDSKLSNVKELLAECRSGLLFLPENM